MKRALLCLVGLGLVVRDVHGAESVLIDVDRIIARVNSTPIWQSAVDEAHGAIDARIDALLVKAAAAAQSVTVSDQEVDEAMGEIAAHNHVTRAELVKLAERQGYAEATYRAGVAEQLLAVKTHNSWLAWRVDGDKPDQAAWLKVLRDAARIERTASTGGAYVPLLYGRIVSVAIDGGNHDDETRVRTLFATQIGGSVDRPRLRKLLDEVMAPQSLADVTLRARQLPRGVQLVVTLVPQPIVVGLTLNERSGSLERGGTAESFVGVRLAPSAVDRRLVELRDEFIRLGNAAIKSSWHTEPRPGGVQLFIDVDLGNRYFVASHAFHGNKHAQAAALEDALQGSARVGAPWQQADVERASLLVKAYYYDHGFIDVAVRVPRQPQSPSAPLTFEIEEGETFRFGQISFSGAPSSELDALRAIVEGDTGALFNRNAFITQIDAVRAHLVAKHPHAVVTPTPAVDRANHTVAVDLVATLN